MERNGNLGVGVTSGINPFGGVVGAAAVNRTPSLEPLRTPPRGEMGEFELASTQSAQIGSRAAGASAFKPVIAKGTFFDSIRLLPIAVVTILAAATCLYLAMDPYGCTANVTSAMRCLVLGNVGGNELRP